MRESRGRRLRSMRASALWVVLAIVVSPLVFVLVSGFIEGAFVDRTLERAVLTSDEVAALINSSAATRAAIDAIAQKHDQRVRLLALDGSTTVDSDHLVGHSWLFALGDLVYGPDRVATLGTFDDAQGPLRHRVEVTLAREDGRAETCNHLARGNLEVCNAALFVAPDVVVHVQGSSRRALESLYESRRQLLKLTLFVLVLALPLWWWMVRRMVRPLEALRAEVLSRADAAVPRADLAVARRDEIGDLTAAFNTLLATLGERERATEAFVADLAHELKNPVATVRACAERLGDSTPRERSDDEVTRTRRLADALDKSASRLDAIVTQLLELARAEAALPNEEREEVDVAAIARGIATASGASEQSARIEVVGTDTPAIVRGVPMRLESVLRNLVDNGLAFAGDGGWVRITIERGEAIAVVVADSGPGIPPDDLPRVFDRFYTTRGATRGTGLGLALVRAVVEAHGGTVVAESPEGAGARFVVKLPPFTRDSHPIH